MEPESISECSLEKKIESENSAVKKSKWAPINTSYLAHVGSKTNKDVRLPFQNFVANRIIQTKPSSISPIRYKSPPLTASQRGIPLKKDVILDDKQESKEVKDSNDRSRRKKEDSYVYRVGKAYLDKTREASETQISNQVTNATPTSSTSSVDQQTNASENESPASIESSDSNFLLDSQLRFTESLQTFRDIEIKSLNESESQQKISPTALSKYLDENPKFNFKHTTFTRELGVNNENLKIKGFLPYDGKYRNDESEEDNQSKAIKREFPWSYKKKIQIDREKLSNLFDFDNKFEEFNRDKIKFLENSERIIQVINKLPPPIFVKNAILQMDNSVLDRKNVLDLIGIAPNADEIALLKFNFAKIERNKLEFDKAEQFLYHLSTISNIKTRLEFWHLILEHSKIEKKILEPLLELESAIKNLKLSKTFKEIILVVEEVESCMFNFNYSQKKFGRTKLEKLSKLLEIKDKSQQSTLLDFVCSTVAKISYENHFSADVFRSFAICVKVNWYEIVKEIDRLPAHFNRFTELYKLLKNDEETVSKTEEIIKTLYTETCKKMGNLLSVCNQIMNILKSLLMDCGCDETEAKQYDINKFCRFMCDFIDKYTEANEIISKRKYKNDKTSEKRSIEILSNECEPIRYFKTIDQISKQEHCTEESAKLISPDSNEVADINDEKFTFI